MAEDANFAFPAIFSNRETLFDLSSAVCFRRRTVGGEAAFNH